MCKFEVRIRTCCCCSLTVATILTAIYLFVYYAILLGLAGWGLSRTAPLSPIGSRTNYYQLCLDEASRPRDQQGAKVYINGVETRVADVSERPFYCSLGLFTEELKFHDTNRFPVLIIDIIIYILLVLCTLLVFAALCVKFHWLLLPCIGMLCLDILRGTISVIFIFILSHGSLIRIAVGIFFLGIQIFHISLVLVLIAKFQRMYELSKGIDYKKEPRGDKSIMAEGSHIYPTLPSHYAYSSSPHARREGYYQPNYYNTYAGKEGRVYRDNRPPSELGVRQHSYQSQPYAAQGERDEYGRTM